MWTGGVGTWGLDKTRGDFVAALTALLGEYATKLDQEAVLAADKNRGRGATPELVVLIGRRFVYVDELEEGRQLDEARVKALTGSERIRIPGAARYAAEARPWRRAQTMVTSGRSGKTAPRYHVLVSRDTLLISGSKWAWAV